ncbi:MAG: tetratricopeptide repeat protein [Acidobacteriota bacterium]
MRIGRIAVAIIVVLGLGLSGTALADKSADASYKEGLAYKEQGKVDEAIASMQAAVAANPKHGMAWASLGHLYKQKKDFAKAIDAYEHATSLITKDKVIWKNLGTAYANVDPPRLDDAERALMTACKLDPKDGQVRGLLGTVKRKKNDYAGAIVQLEIAVKTKDADPEWWHSLGVAYRFAKREDDAIMAYQKAIEGAPNEARYHFDLGAAYRRKQDPDKAIPEYVKATELDPGFADAWFDLGFMYKENHENDKAIDALNHYLAANKGKDAGGQKRAQDECAALGAKCGDAKGTKGPTKKKPPRSKK